MSIASRKKKQKCYLELPNYFKLLLLPFLWSKLYIYVETGNVLPNSQADRDLEARPLTILLVWLSTFAMDFYPSGGLCNGPLILYY